MRRDRRRVRGPRSTRPGGPPGAERGLGPARNAGISEATGDYLVFLDGDDTLTPHALRAIADRLKETGEPDVLLHDHALVPCSGEIVRNAVTGQLSEQGPAPFRLEERPGLLRVPTAAWNKAYRREFVESGGFAFPSGHHADTPWTYPVLMTAESIATLDRVCVHHRQRRRSRALGTAGHFDIFDQYDRVFAHVDSRPELAQWRPVLFRSMADDLWAVFADRDRLRAAAAVSSCGGPATTTAPTAPRARSRCAPGCATR